MFEGRNAQTSEVLSNQTAEQVADYLRGEGATHENEELRMGDEVRVYENPEWLDQYHVEYVGSDDAEEAFGEVEELM